MRLQDLENTIGQIDHKKLQVFTPPYGDVLVTKKVTPTKKLQKLASSLFSSNVSGPFYRLKLDGVARLFLAELLEQYFQPNSHKNKLSVIEKQIYKKTSEFINANLKNRISIDRLAEQHEISNNRLNWIFKQQSGATVADFIYNERQNMAHKLLLESSLSVKQIALQVGYHHVGNFSRAYKKKFGEAPSRTQMS